MIVKMKVLKIQKVACYFHCIKKNTESSSPSITVILAKENVQFYSEKGEI